MSSEDAPTGKVIQASGGNFSLAAMFTNQGAQLGVDASYESVVDNLYINTDMSNIVDGVDWRQRMRAQTQEGQGSAPLTGGRDAISVTGTVLSLCSSSRGICVGDNLDPSINEKAMGELFFQWLSIAQSTFD